MNSLILILGITTLLAGLVLGGMALAYIIGTDIHRWMRRFRGEPTKVRCPRTGQLMRIRVGLAPAPGMPRVFWCERFADGEVHCLAECVSREVRPAARAA